MKTSKRNTMKSLSIVTTLFAGVLLFVSACDLTSHLDESPPHIMTPENLFQDADGFNTAINGLYSRARGELDQSNTGGSIVTFNAGTDCCVVNHDATYMIARTLQDFGDVLGPANQFVERNWVWLYEVVNIANNIIHNAEGDDSPLSGQQKNRILADAKAVRAWAYRHLTYLFGDVPLSLEPSSGEAIRLDWERAPINQVRNQMLEDWLFAQEHLPVEGTLAGRMTKGAVQHYLAETYLAIGDDQTALQWANTVIDNPAYELITDRFGVNAGEPGVTYMDLFEAENIDRSSGHTEALWIFNYEFGVTGGDNYSPILRRKIQSRYERISVDGVTPLQVTHQRGGRANARMGVTKWFLDLYEDDDDRNSEHAIRYFFVLQDAEGNAPHAADNLPPGWAYGDTLWQNWDGDITADNVGRIDWPYPRKFDWALPENPRINENMHNILYLRLADTYLLKAEAQYKLGDAAGAAQTINAIRTRSNATPITAADVDLDFILDERSRELIYEEQRRYTLVRTGKLLERARAHNNNGGQFIQDRHVLFPIPQSVIDANETEFPQNTGYN